MRHWLVMVLLLLALAGVGKSDDTLNTVPSRNATFYTDLSTFLHEEYGDRSNEMFVPFVVSGGTHGLAASMTSPAFATTAYVGHHAVQASATINYATAGCANDDTAFVIVTKDTTTAPGGNFGRVTGSHYAVDCQSATKPTLPADAAWLLQATLAGGQITGVQDLRTLHPLLTTVDNTHNLGTPMREMQAWFGDGFSVATSPRVVPPLFRRPA